MEVRETVGTGTCEGHVRKVHRYAQRVRMVHMAGTHGTYRWYAWCVQ